MRKLIGLYLLKNYRFSYCDCLPFLNEIGVLTLTIHEILLLFLVSYLLLGYVPYGENKKQSKKKKNRCEGLLFPTLFFTFKPLAHRLNVASLSLFYGYYFGCCSCELAELVPILEGVLLVSDFQSDNIPRSREDVNVHSLFLRIAKPWNPLPARYFVFTKDFLVCFSFLYASYSWLSIPCSGCLVLYRMNLNPRKKHFSLKRPSYQNFYIIFCLYI